MNQSCMRCKSLKFEDMQPVCVKGCAAWDSELFSDSRYLHDHHPMLRTGDMVEMGGKFFFVEPDRFDEYQNGVRELSAVKATDFVDMPEDLSADEMAQLRESVLNDYLEELGVDSLEDLATSVEDPGEGADLVAEAYLEFETIVDEALLTEQEIAEEAAIRGLSTERYHGLRYHFLGRFFQAIVEPILWSSGCEQGVHRFLNQPFSSNVDVASSEIAVISHSVNKAKSVVQRLAKVMWAEKQLEILSSLNIKPATCICGAPMHPSLSTCEWCTEDAMAERRDRSTQFKFSRAARQVINATPKAKQIPATVTIVDMASTFAEALPRAYKFFMGIETTTVSEPEIECPI